MMSSRPLTALAEAQAALLTMLAPAQPREAPCEAAIGLIAAESARVTSPQPPRAIALRAGYALHAGDLAGATSFSPAFLASPPRHVAAGEALPAGCDCVVDPAALDLSGPMAQAFVESYPGENVRRVGEDFAEGAIIVAQGCRISALHALAASRAGMTTLAVRRPRVSIDGGDDIGAMVAHLARAQGADVSSKAPADLIIALAVAPTDAIILVQGVALEPGRDLAIGRIGATPVVVLPRQPDQAFAGMVALVRPALDRLAGRLKPAPVSLPLSAKVSSRVGLAEIALLQADEGRFIPLAVGDIPLQAIARATHVALIAAGGEGHAAGDLCAADPLDA